MLLGARIVIIVPHSTNINEHLLATQIPRRVSSSWYALCLRYANSPFRFANESSSPLTVAKNKGHPQGMSLFFGAGRGIRFSLLLGHARGKTTLSCFLTLSRRFATRAFWANGFQDFPRNPTLTQNNRKYQTLENAKNPNVASHIIYQIIR